MIRQLDGLLIGGDLLIRFDKNLAPGYAPPGLSTLCASGIHHPTGDWLTPALMALQHDVPVAWNAPGMYCDEVPDWAKPLMERALTLSAYRTVRDELSRNVLEPLTTALIDVVPDTAFGLSRLLDFQGAPTTQFTQFAEAYQLKSPYLVFQHCSGFEGVHRLIRNHPERFGRFRFLMLPISPEFGQHSESIECDLPGVIRLAEWPNPLLTAELIGRAEAVLGHSYRLSITALAAGVPVFRRVDLSAGKFTALQHFESIFILPDGTLDPEWFLAHIGRTTPSAAAGATLGPLSAHWDRIAAMVREKAAPTAPMLDRFWQSLPGLLENAGARLT
jgi:lipopolysaccharide transport system ATP-binding protein